TPTPPAKSRPSGAVWQVRQLPIAARSPPRLTSEASKLVGAGRFTGSMAGRQTTATVPAPTITTTTANARTVLCNIGHLRRHLNPKLAPRVPARDAGQAGVTRARSPVGYKRQQRRRWFGGRYRDFSTQALGLPSFAWMRDRVIRLRGSA